ncbi:phosphonate ABC transporter ATP-binding protein [Asticcacaulis sp. AND118]|uniref:phosphonate ABC transporter ATP-binding protein n=1 Tax=Asticcacaulis sp. AND118 TaxID=2840468 RepID=UPI001CFFFD05|nr:phosphonate ABC transporter ATP-binding protein [Asticcacaulis sp. AND118]UDF03702.1 phosphonate ABC transporter ATP-binding protein [Asticcacaulis sp. AND118]
MPSLVEVQSLSRTFALKAQGDAPARRFKALDDVSFSMSRPERIGLIGPSGSGKSTLLRSLSGLILGDEGSGPITVRGRIVQNDGKLGADVRAARADLGMVAQQFNLVGRLSLFTNAALGLLGRIPHLRGLLGLWTPEEKQRVMQALHTVGIADKAPQRAKTLSGGQQQRGAIARAIVQDARLILADEPVASLDPVTARKVMELLMHVNEDRGVGVIVTLHQVDYAMKYCDRILALKDGKIVYDGPADGLSLERLTEIYGPEIEQAYWRDPS